MNELIELSKRCRSLRYLRNRLCIEGATIEVSADIDLVIGQRMRVATDVLGDGLGTGWLSNFIGWALSGQS